MAPRPALLASLALLLASSAGEASHLEALPVDDECAAADGQCALNALQLRGARLASGDAEPGDKKKKTKKKKDLSPAWAKELEQQMTQLMHDINDMEAKMKCLGIDLQSTNQTLFDVPNATVGVNGSVVVWTNHDAHWYPEFCKPEVPAAAVPDIDAEDIEEEEPELLSSETEVHAHPHKKGKKLKKAKPHVNLHGRVKAEMMYQQNRLTELWSSLVAFRDKISQTNEFMTVTPRRFNGTLVLSQLDQVVPKKGHKCKGKAGKGKKCKPPKPQDDILEALDGSKNSTRMIWDTMGEVDLEMETLKRRVVRYKAGLPPPTTAPPTTTAVATTTAAAEVAKDESVPPAAADEEEAPSAGEAAEDEDPSEAEDEDPSEEVVALAQRP